MMMTELGSREERGGCDADDGEDFTAIRLQQRMNYHVAQLPWSRQCPGAPCLGASRQLHDLVASYN